jgi:hypothetical protein
MLTQILIGAALIVSTVLIHAVSLELTLKALLSVRAEILVRWRTVAIALVVLAVFAAHVIEIWVWAIFYYMTASITEIPTWEAALYFSTSSFTTVGFGDLVLSEDWRLLSSFESTNGMILFGWSTAFIFEVVRQTYGHIYRSSGGYFTR